MKKAIYIFFKKMMTNKAADMSRSNNVAYPVFIVSHFSTLSLYPEHDLIQYFALQLK
jgi:hypothetical protein